jgi:hypothetical protein
LAEQLAAGLLSDRPDLGGFPEAVASWATSEAQAALLRRRLAEVGPLDDNGEPRKGLLGWLRTFERAAAEARRPLGLDPLSEALVSRTRAEVATLAVDLEALAARGRAALEAREAAGGEPDIAGRVLEAQRAEYAAERAIAADVWAAEQTEEGR